MELIPILSAARAGGDQVAPLAHLQLQRDDGREPPRGGGLDVRRRGQPHLHPRVSGPDRSPRRWSHIDRRGPLQPGGPRRASPGRINVWSRPQRTPLRRACHQLTGGLLAAQSAAGLVRFQRIPCPPPPALHSSR